MNQIYILGNGFDLAHGLNTSYNNFLVWLLNKKYIEIREKLKSGGGLKDFLMECSASYSNYIINERSFTKKEEFSVAIEEEKKRPGFAYSSSQLLSKILSNEKWADVEKAYFSCMLYLTDPSTNSKKYNIEYLNSSFTLLKAELKNYLDNIDKKEGVIVDEITKIFSRPLKSDRYSKVVVNFNYTSTIQRYITKAGISRVINIHGSHDDFDSMIFGYGDEMHKKYPDIEALDNNRYLENMKSVGYFNSLGLSSLFQELDHATFEVHLLGHSMGISDRLLFSDIFKHENFSKVYIHHFVENGKTNFNDVLMNLTRHFSPEKKGIMRRRIAPFNSDYCMSVIQ